MLIETPPMLGGTTEQQLRSMYSYLYQMAEQLNNALNNITEENFAPEAAQAIKEVTTGVMQTSTKQQADTLKSLIVKTADTVQAEMEALETTLKSDYVAQSEFGEYRQTTDGRITQTANGLELANKRTEEVYGEFDTYKTAMEGRIRIGNILVTENEKKVIKTGILISQDFVTEEYQGKIIYAKKGMMTTYTADRISFWQNEVELAYITSGVLHFPRAQLSDSLVVGKYIIKKLSDESFGIIVAKTEG